MFSLFRFYSARWPKRAAHSTWKRPSNVHACMNVCAACAYGTALCLPCHILLYTLQCYGKWHQANDGTTTVVNYTTTQGGALYVPALTLPRFLCVRFPSLMLLHNMRNRRSFTSCILKVKNVPCEIPSCPICEIIRTSDRPSIPAPWFRATRQGRW